MHFFLCCIYWPLGVTKWFVHHHGPPYSPNFNKMKSDHHQTFSIGFWWSSKVILTKRGMPDWAGGTQWLAHHWSFEQCRIWVRWGKSKLFKRISWVNFIVLVGMHMLVSVHASLLFSCVQGLWFFFHVLTKKYSASKGSNTVEYSGGRVITRNL